MSHNDDVDDINKEMLKLSADSVKDNGEGELLYQLLWVASFKAEAQGWMFDDDPQEPQSRRGGL